MLRLLFAFPVALLVTAALFTLMAWMVDNGHSSKVEQSPAQAFDIVMQEQQQTLNRRQRALPEKPQTPPPPIDNIPVNNAAQPLALPDMPLLAIDTAEIGIEVGLPELGHVNNNQQAMPLYRVEPRYPARAIKLGAQGRVELSFTIDSTGRPIDIKILSAKPRHMFEKSAVRALRKWKYQPTLVEGKAVAQVGQKVTLEFKLSK